MTQIVESKGSLPAFLDSIRESRPFQRLFVVCGSHCAQLEPSKAVKGMAALPQIWFDDFKANPDYRSVAAGIEIFTRNRCDAILAIGGGSALDVAKCIKLYYGLNPGENLLLQKPVPNDIPLIAMPTTAGTGSEATRYAVIYLNGEKQSVSSTDIIPEYVFLDASVLESLPSHQKSATVMDAMCHAVESMWSVNSTEESRGYSESAIRMILAHLDGYLRGDSTAAANMLIASNLAGKAINITQTTAGHAMCYKLTSLFRFPHGQAAALCVNALWPYMLTHTEQTCDVRGKAHLEQIFADLAGCFGVDTPEAACQEFRKLVEKLGLNPQMELNAPELEKLVDSVNPVRLKNHPIPLTKDSFRTLYTQIFNQ